jgi:hypothetical protein
MIDPPSAVLQCPYWLRSRMVSAALTILRFARIVLIHRGTLPAIVGGYSGNPFLSQTFWIEDTLAVGQKQGRWPDNVLEIANDGSIHNKFTEFVASATI